MRPSAIAEAVETFGKVRHMTSIAGSIASVYPPKHSLAALATESIAQTAPSSSLASLSACIPTGIASIGLTDETKRMLERARAFRQLLEVLAMAARAFRASA